MTVHNEYLRSVAPTQYTADLGGDRGDIGIYSVADETFVVNRSVGDFSTSPLTIVVNALSR